MADYDFRTARLRATKFTPYLTKLIMSTIPLEKPGIGTMATDCYLRIYYDPAFLDEITLDEASLVIIHECMHILLDHASRAKVKFGGSPNQEQAQIWNLAGDASINRTIKEGVRGSSLPKGAVYPDTFSPVLKDNASTEEHYDQLDKQLPRQKGGKGGQGGQGGEGDHQSGSSADGVARDWDEEKPAQGDGKEGEGQGKGAPGMSDYDVKQIVRSTAKDIAEAARKSRGSVPAGLARYVDKLLKPRFDPRREIMSEVRYALNCTKGFGMTSWKRPNRRETGGMRMPSHMAPLPNVTVIVDTSGSMGSDDLGLALGVIAECINTLPHSAGVRVISGDTRAAMCEKVFSKGRLTSKEDASSILQGGGGTDMGAIMLEAIAKYPETDVMLVVSDGWTPWPAKELHCRCLALLTQDSDEYGGVPKWMKKVQIRPQEDRS